MEHGASALERCVGDVDRFLSSDWGRRPRYVPAVDARAFDDLLPLGDVDHIVATMALRAPAFRLVRDGSPVPAAEYLRRARVGSRPIDDLIDVGRVGAAFREGATIVLQGVQRYWPPVTAFCRELEQSLTHAVQANAYVTPPGSSGFEVHADTHDVFALQTHGRKRWVVYPHDEWPPEQSEPSEPWDLRLEPGDCLYLPKGVRHAAETVAAPSVHLTIGVRHTTWREVLRRAVEEALADAVLDEALPPGFANDPASLAVRAKAHVRELAEAIASHDAADLVDEAATAFWAARVPTLHGHLQDLLDLDDVGDETPVRRRPGAVCAVRSGDGQVRIVLGDRTLTLPGWVEPAVRQVAASDHLRPSDLGEQLDVSSRIVLVRRLIREGLLEMERG
jgi:bifunctional lysine-specific demethylase and histidyl-hydroxylase NO66